MLAWWITGADMKHADQYHGLVCWFQGYAALWEHVSQACHCSLLSTNEKLKNVNSSAALACEIKFYHSLISCLVVTKFPLVSCTFAGHHKNILQYWCSFLLLYSPLLLNQANSASCYVAQGENQWKLLRAEVIQVLDSRCQWVSNPTSSCRA